MDSLGERDSLLLETLIAVKEMGVRVTALEEKDRESNRKRWDTNKLWIQALITLGVSAITCIVYLLWLLSKGLP